MKHGIELLQQGMNDLGLNISEKQINQFLKYYEMLIETNKKMNLTTIVEIDDVIVKHFLDSLLLVKITDLSKTHSIIDVGTGAGFPGIPIKIMFPDIKMTLLDSLNKRLCFLNEVISELELSDIQTIHGRAEDVAKQIDYREQFDMCVSRAVANLAVLSEFCLPFVNTGGVFVSYKSSTSDDEINQAESAIGILGGKIIEKKNVLLPCSEVERTFICVKKIKTTNPKYPRKAGMPTKKPLGQ